MATIRSVIYIVAICLITTLFLFNIIYFLLNENICPEIRQADIIIAATGKNNLHYITKEVNEEDKDNYKSIDTFNWNLCSSLPKFSDYMKLNLDNFNESINLLLNTDPLTIEKVSALIEPYISCLPWSKSESFQPAHKIVYDIDTIESECKLYPDVFTGNIYPSGEEMFIVDLFAFAYEMDVLEIRVNMLYNLVNHFVLLEDIYAQRIVKKPLFYERNKHHRFKTLDLENKIIHFIKDDTNNYNLYHAYFENQTLRKMYYNPKSKKHTDWRNENYFREAGFLKYIRNVYDNNINIFLNKHPNAILLISDLDEVPDPEKLKLLKYCQIHQHLVDQFWDNTQGRIVESSYQFYTYNFNVFWGNRGIKSFMFRIDDDLYNKFVNNYFVFNRNKRGHSTTTWFHYLTKINYTGWHFSRVQTIYQLYLKHLYLAEGGNVLWLTKLCHIENSDIKKVAINWTFVNLWNHHNIINVDYFKKYYGNIITNFSNYKQCEKEMLLNPHLIKIFTDNGAYPMHVRGLMKNGYLTNGCANNTWQLPQYLKINRNKYQYFFPKFCKLKNAHNLFGYDCDWSHFDNFYDDEKSCWMTRKESYSC